MVGVSGTPLSEEMPDGSRIVLDYSWDSGAGADVMVNRITEAPSGMLETEELFYTENVPREWHLGHFTEDDVAKKFGGKFNQIVVRERQKLGKRLRGKHVPSDVADSRTLLRTLTKGLGRGWHGEPERHRRAAKKGRKK